MQFKLKCCWDCGKQIVFGEPGRYTLGPDYTRVRFGLSDGSYCEPGFCRVCATRLWPVGRIRALQTAIERASPTPQSVTITKVEGTSRPEMAVVLLDGDAPLLGKV